MIHIHAWCGLTHMRVCCVVFIVYIGSLTYMLGVDCGLVYFGFMNGFMYNFCLRHGFIILLSDSSFDRGNILEFYARISTHDLFEKRWLHNSSSISKLISISVLHLECFQMHLNIDILLFRWYAGGASWLHHNKRETQRDARKFSSPTVICQSHPWIIEHATRTAFQFFLIIQHSSWTAFQFFIIIQHSSRTSFQFFNDISMNGMIIHQLETSIHHFLYTQQTIFVHC